MKIQPLHQQEPPNAKIKQKDTKINLNKWKKKKNEYTYPQQNDHEEEKQNSEEGEGMIQEETYQEDDDLNQTMEKMGDNN